MRVLLDENIDRRLKILFDCNCTIVTVKEYGWGGKRNGELLRLANAEFDVFITMDKGIEYQQNIDGFKLSIIIIHAHSNRRQDVALAMPNINEILNTVQKGVIIHVMAYKEPSLD